MDPSDPSRVAAQVLSELIGDKSLDRFRTEYEKLHRALKKSHESEKRLIKKCRELNAEIVSNAAKVQTALKLSQEDQNTIGSLKREIEKAWKMVDASHEKEARAKETIQQLKTEIQNLSRLVEQGAGLSMGQENAVNELLKAKEELTLERDEQMAKIAEMRSQISETLEKMRQMDEQKVLADREMQTLKELVTTKRAEAEREARRKDRLEKEMKDVKHLTETRGQELRVKTETLKKLSDRLELLENQVKSQRSHTDMNQKAVEAARARHAKVTQEIEEQTVQVNALRSENQKQRDELRRRELESDQCLQDIQKKTKDRDAVLKQSKQLEDGKGELMRQADMLKAAISSAEREISREHAEHDKDKKAIVELEKDREMLTAALTAVDGETSQQVDLVKLNEQLRKELETDIAGHKLQSLKQRKTIYHLEKEREKFGDEVSDVHTKVTKVLEEIKLRDMTLQDVQKEIVDADAKLKDHQRLYESVRADRNLYSKNLIEAQDEIAEMKRKFKIMNHQIEQLKEEIQAKESAYVKEHFEHQKVEKEREVLKAELDRVKKTISQTDHDIANFKKEVNKLSHIINEADADRHRQQQDYDQIVAERDVLGTQLIRKNDELALICEKLKIQQATLTKGMRSLVRFDEDSRLLRIARSNMVREVRREKLAEAEGKPCGGDRSRAIPPGQMQVAKRQSSSIDQMQENVYALQRELLTERTKVKALSEELENPNNPHRWRRLEGVDPSPYEMVQKIQALQKRLIVKTEEVRPPRYHTAVWCAHSLPPLVRRWWRRTCSCRRRRRCSTSSRASSPGSPGPTWRSSSLSTTKACARRRDHSRPWPLSSTCVRRK